MFNVFVLLNKGFEEIEALTIVDYLRRAEIEVNMVSVSNDEYVEGGHGIVVKSDILFSNLSIEDIDLLFIPGGMPAAQELSENKSVTDLVKNIYEKGKIVSSICAGPLVLEKSGVLEENAITSYPGFENKLESAKNYVEEKIVISNNLITSRGPATAVFLALELIRQIKGEKASKEIADQILVKYIEK